MSRFNASKDYYSILGASEDASQSEIERLYKRLAVQHHPDRGGDEEEMKSLNEAYRVLRDETERHAYDVERRNGAEAEEAESFAQPYAQPSAKVDVFTGQWVGAILFIAVGLVLALLVRFQWIWFLWPLAILAAFLVLVGLLMAHAAMRRVGSEQKRARAWLGVTLEVAFWTVVVGGGYGIYLIIS
jgi:ABC-type siderophore export system fused ATPase/permease subunit